MQLSKRLAAVADMVTPGEVLADIGTDHAYIPITLVEQNRIPRAIAADVNSGPLARAQKHISERHLSDRIETRLSDGLAALHPGEVQSIVIAGMGGALTVRILREGAELLEDRKRSICELILQPQSEIPQVRAYLEETGWSIVREDMIFEDGKYYSVMKAVPFPPQSFRKLSSPMNSLQLLFGPKLLESRHPVLRQFLLHERVTQERILESLGRGKTVVAETRVQEIREKLAMIDEALRICAADAR